MEYLTNKHEDLVRLADAKPVLLVFLRHFGCAFCRETMTELAHVKKDIEADGVRIVIVHMVRNDIAEQVLQIYELAGLSHISDPDLELYHAFGLKRATIREFFGFRNWWRTIVAGVYKGHFIGKPIGDTFQMPGVFVYYKKRILNKYTYKYVSDMPNFVNLIRMQNLSVALPE